MRVHAEDGSEHASFLVSENLITGLIALVSVLAIVIVSGVIIARFTSRREAALNLAFILGWVAWTGGRMGEVFRVNQGGFVPMALEAALIGFAVVMVLCLGSSESSPDDDHASRFDRTLLLQSRGMGAIGISIVVSLALVWVFGQTDLPGQSLWATFAAGIGAGLSGAMSQQSKSHGKQDEHVSLIPMIVGVLIAGVIAPLIGMVMPGSGGLLDSVRTGSLPGWLAVSPIAWSVGALIGVPVGWGWVESTVAMQDSSAPATR